MLVLLVTWLVAGSSPVRRDFEGLERRRRRAARMLGRGATQAEVAGELEVSRQSVSRCHADWQAGATGALKAGGRTGRMPRLTTTQLHQVNGALR
ncbi:MAG: helix-turn-helix domain-containing protein [Candidatus Limnocylindria bacterium]